MGVGARGVLALCVLAAPARAWADDAARVDWARGLVIAGGIGVADRHAPSPAVARGTSRRGAEDAAKHALAAAIAALPVARGGGVGDKAAAALAAIVELDAEPESDGAWHVTMAVPIEAVRQAISGGGRAVAIAGDHGPPIVVVDGAAAAKPAVGWTIGGIAAATLWMKALPPWAKDAPHVTATTAAGGVIDAGKLPEGAGAGTLFVVLQP